MTDGEALLAAIRANKEDDTPRLVFADWLDENGQKERAEFIRLQIKIDQSICAGIGEMQRDLLRQRERELFEVNQREWFPPPIVACLRFNPTGQPFPHLIPGGVSRGFVSHLVCSWESWCAHAAVIVACHPIEWVMLETDPGDSDWAFYSGRRIDGTRSAKFPCWHGIKFELPPA